jgi:DNA repair exonuclease SbcCD ATPase subunit
MERCRLPMNRWLSHLTALTMVVLLVSACATTTPNVAPVAQPPPPPAKATGHVVNIKNSLPVRVDTSLTSKQLGDLKLNEQVYIDEEIVDWYHVIQITEERTEEVKSKYSKAKPLRSGPLSGWVRSQYIERDIVVPPPDATVSAGQPGAEGNKDLTGMKVRTILEGGAAGAALGAGLGALTAYITGGDIAKGAIIGAAAGGAAGLVAGVSVAKQKEKFATEEAYLDACAKEAAQNNEEARKANEYLRGYVSDMQLRIKELKAQIKKDKTKKQAARDELETLNGKKQGVDEMITKLQDDAKAQDGALAGAKKGSPESAKLQQEVKSTQQEIDKLKKQRAELVNLTTKMNDLSV